MEVPTVVKVIFSDKRVRMYDGSMKGSNISRKKDVGVGEAVLGYWRQCLFCGAEATGTRIITEAHIIGGVKGHDYSDFGSKAGYKLDLDVSCGRNYIPLCGTHGEEGSCHNEFDNFKCTLLWNPLVQQYYIYCLQSCTEYIKSFHGKVVSIPQAFAPYRRLLATRAYKCGLQNYEFNMLDLPNISVPMDTLSNLGSSSSSSSSSSNCSTSTTLLNSNNKRILTQAEEEKMAKRKKYDK